MYCVISQALHRMSCDSDVTMTGEEDLLAEMPCYDNRNFSMYDSSKVLVSSISCATPSSL